MAFVHETSVQPSAGLTGFTSSVRSRTRIVRADGGGIRRPSFREALGGAALVHVVAPDLGWFFAYHPFGHLRTEAQSPPHAGHPSACLAGHVGQLWVACPQIQQPPLAVGALFLGGGAVPSEGRFPEDDEPELPCGCR